jgi:hypothetical protein
MSVGSVKALIGSSRHADVTSDDGRTGEGTLRFEAMCHRLRTPDNADSTQDETLFFTKQRPSESRAVV